MRIVKGFTIILFLTGLLIGPVSLYADVAIKLVVVNPSESDKKLVPVKYKLPPDLKKEDIKDAGGLSVGYDMKEGVYTVEGALELEPKENRVLKIVVSDVWIIPSEKFDNLKDMLRESAEATALSNDPKKVGEIAARIEEKIETLKRIQKDSESDIESRVSRYTAINDELGKIKENIFSMDLLVKEEILRAETKEKEETVKLVVEAANEKDEQLDTVVKYYLPDDVKPEQIVEFEGFVLKYDIEKRKSFLEKEVSFKPGETLKWTISVKNEWLIQEAELTSILTEADKTMEGMAGTKYSVLCKALHSEIKFLGAKILESQGETETVDEMISVYKVNEERFKIIKDDLIKMQSLASKDSSKKHNVLRDIDVNKDMKQVSDVLMKKIFKKGKISLFKMILGLIVFVVVVTLIACLSWMAGIKKQDNVEPVDITAGDKVEGKKEDETGGETGDESGG